MARIARAADARIARGVRGVMGIAWSEMWRAWRASVRRPGFLLLASGVLALGIGVMSTVFSMIDGVLLEPLPYPQAQQLAALGPVEQGDVGLVSSQQYQQLADLPGVAKHGLFRVLPTVNVAGSDSPVMVSALEMDRGLLPTLRVRPVLGRNFDLAEDRPHGAPAVLLFHGFWKRHFGGNPSVIGRSMRVEGVAHTIVGVLPAGFDLGRAQIALPSALPSQSHDDSNVFTMVVRRQPGSTLHGLGAQVVTRMRGVRAERGQRETDLRREPFGAQGFGEQQHAGQRAMAVMWLACAALLLLLVVVNLTNLMVLRSMNRDHEASIRGALGASPWRMALPLIAEGLLIGLVALLIGQALAASGLLALRTCMPVDWMAVEWTRPDGLRLGGRAWALAGFISVLSALMAASLGLWRGRAALSMTSLREGGRSGLGRRGAWVGRALVIAQVALASLLLCAAGIFLHTLLDNARTNLGFDPRGVLTFELAPVERTYPDASAVHTLSRRLTERLQRMPGVEQATMTTNLPAGDDRGQFNIGGLHLPGGEEFNEQFRGVGPGYFHLFGIHVLKGRAFADGDVRGGEAVAIVNQRFADVHYGGHALGKTIQQFALKRPRTNVNILSARIVGVVANTYQFGPEDPDSVRPILYLPFAQMPEDDLLVFRGIEPLRFALKVHGRPERYRAAVRRAVAEVAPDQPISRLYSMADIVHDITSDTKFSLLLVGVLGSLALLLASVGMYSVMAMAVTARAREFGVRAAMGASPRGLLLQVVRSGLVQIAWGLIIGLLMGVAGSGLLHAAVAQLGRRMFDPWSMAAVCLVLGAAGVMACLAPARRAGRVQPMLVLRGE
ncbi:ABC transporter permease [Oleiagrimonas citrea]|nr:ABC transporter permease [Oleiagrimonas citrea]